VPERNLASIPIDKVLNELEGGTNILSQSCRLGKTSKPSLDASTRLASSVPSLLTTRMRLSLMDVGRDQQKVRILAQVVALAA
jgi:hypothetical protein